jgi:hypothetical protein
VASDIQLKFADGIPLAHRAAPGRMWRACARTAPIAAGPPSWNGNGEFVAEPCARSVSKAIFGSSFRLAPLSYRRPFWGSCCATAVPASSAAPALPSGSPTLDHVVPRFAAAAGRISEFMLRSTGLRRRIHGFDSR